MTKPADALASTVCALRYLLKTLNMVVKKKGIKYVSTVIRALPHLLCMRTPIMVLDSSSLRTKMGGLLYPSPDVA